MQSGYAPVNELELYYEIHGNGQPLVLIHGGGSTINTSFGNLIPLLAPKYKIIAVEMQAHGHTKDRNTPETFEQDANDIAALLQHLKIDKANILGFSNGGQTTIQIGIHHPNIASKLIIISAFYKKEGVITGFFDGFPDATLDNMPKVYHEEYLKINNDRAGLQRMFNQDKNRMMNFTGWTDEEISSIKIPTLIIAGDKDIVTPEHCAEMARRMPNAKLLIVPGTHGSFIGEINTVDKDSKMPEAVAAIVEEFLEG